MFQQLPFTGKEVQPPPFLNFSTILWALFGEVKIMRIYCEVSGPYSAPIQFRVIFLDPLKLPQPKTDICYSAHRKKSHTQESLAQNTLILQIILALTANEFSQAAMCLC